MSHATKPARLLVAGRPQLARTPALIILVWTRIVPGPAERATFVLAASLVLALLFWLWRPVGGTVWKLPGPGAGALRAAYAADWAVAVSSTFLISHFDLFGLRQAWLHARRIRYSHLPFTEFNLIPQAPDHDHAIAGTAAVKRLLALS